MGRLKQLCSVALVAAFVSCIPTGCTTTGHSTEQQIDVQAFLPTFRTAAYFGTKAVLASNPEYRAAFVGGEAALRALTGDVETAKVAFLAIIESFPIQGITDDDKRVLVSGALDQLEWLVKRLDVIPDEDVKGDVIAVATAIADGIGQALK